jgi:transposase
MSYRATFTVDNGAAIQAACAHFIVLCREIGLFTQAVAAVDGSKFKAVNTRDKTFTPTKLKKRIEQVAAHIAGYLQDLDTADRQEGEAVEARSAKLDKIEILRTQMQMLRAMEAQVAASPDGQVSLTDPDARAMATSGRGIVGYNVQSAVDAEHHLIVAHDVVMAPTDRNQLTWISAKAKDAMGVERLDVLADRGYFAGEEILACEAIGVTPYVPKPLTGNARLEGRFGKQDFTYIPEQDVYRCPAGNLLPYHMTTVDTELTLHRYWDLESCRACAIKPRCTTSLNRRIMLGARGDHRSHAAADGPGALGHARQTPDRRTPLRDNQKLDGQPAPADEAAEERENRDRSPRAGLQHEARDADPRDRPIDGGHQGLMVDVARPRPTGQVRGFYTAAVSRRR